jgi:predicted TIM-barrel fold metal-dependent hydrolase
MIFSADSHFIEPKTFYLDRLPRFYQGYAPRVIEIDGTIFWTDSYTLVPLETSLAAFCKPQELAFRGGIDIYNQVSDIEKRLQFQNDDFVTCEVLLPDTGLLWRIREVQTKLMCFDIYNDYADEIEKHTDRFLMPRVLPSMDEVYLNKIIDNLIESQRSARSFVIDMKFMAKIIQEKAYSSLMEKLNEINANIILHANGYKTDYNFKYPYMAKASMLCVNAMELLQDAYMRKFFDRWSNIKFIFSEVGYKWIDYLAQKVEYYENRYEFLEKIDKPEIPFLHICKKNIFYTFTNDLPVNHSSIYAGTENLLYGTDFPHADSTYLLSKEYFHQFEGVNVNIANSIFIENGRRIFQHK